MTAKPIGSLARDIVLRCIPMPGDPKATRQRVAICVDEGLLTADEARDLLIELGLEPPNSSA